MSNPLLIMITRTEGDDEWNDVWRFPADQIIAFIRQGSHATLAVGDVGPLRLSQELDADVWVINGGLYLGPSSDAAQLDPLDAALDAIDWTKREVTLKIHLGGATKVKSSDEHKKTIEEIPYENTKAFLKRAQDYSLGNDPTPGHPVVRFAAAIRENAPSETYIECLKALRAETPLYMRISNAMHRLSYVLHPLDIDFQGLQDTNFQLDYWQEVVEDYKGGKALGKLKQARNLIYKRDGNENDTAENVIVEALDRFQSGPWEESWRQLQREFLPRDRGPETIESILLLAEDGSKRNLEKIKSHFSDGQNPVHTWVRNIDRTLSDVRDALSDRERQVKPEQSN